MPPTPEKKVVVLCSVGMDSVTDLYAAYEDHKVVESLSFHYGSKHNDREIPFAQWHSEHLGVPHHKIDLDFIGEQFDSDLLKKGGEIPKRHYEEESMKKTVVPFRNGIMLSIAAGFAESKGAQGLVIAAHSGDHAIYPDCREGFMQAMGDAIRLGTYAEIELLRPFINTDKAGIAEMGNNMEIDFSKTWSCYVGGEVHCGECGTCVERREAFILSGVLDPTAYLSEGPLPPKPSA
jgi:7-cyano-7-deazaguanine synthase